MIKESARFIIFFNLLSYSLSLFPAINKLGRLPATSVINSPCRPTVVRRSTCRWNGSQHAVQPDIGSESRFLPTPPAFDAPVRSSPSEYCHNVWCGITRMVWLHDGGKSLKIRSFVSTESTNVTARQTGTAWRHMPRLYIASRGKN